MAVIGFHTGAGSTLSKTARVELEELSKTIVQKCRDLLSKDRNQTAAELAVEVMAMLEDTPLTNCGTGSELTIDGTVECDACMVQCTNGRRVAGAVGSLSGIKNPIRVCQKLIEKQLECSSVIGRAEPGFLVSAAAKQFAVERKLPQANLETPRAQRAFKKWQAVLDEYQVEAAADKCTDMHTVTDTVGVFVIVSADDFACCSSSGGILLKSSGRIGPAAMPGSGADLSTRHKSLALTSGFGEDIMSCMLARSVCTDSEMLDDVVKELQTEAYLQRPDPYFGILRAQIADNRTQVFVDYFHSTESMCITVYSSESNCVKRNFGNSVRSSSGGWRFPL